MTAITLKGVNKRYGANEILSDICLDIKEGEFVSLVGASGCGKTTLLKMIADLETITSGNILVKGKTPEASRKKLTIGLAAQRSALFPNRTALENVQLSLKIAKTVSHFDPVELLEAFGLGKFLNYYPHALSGGMQQRVNIASAMVYDPPILLMDEPFGALDEITRRFMWEWLGEILLENPKTVLFITHNLEEAVLLSDRVILLSPLPGRICREYKIDFPRPRTRDLTIKLDFLKKLAEIRSYFNEVVEVANGNGGTK